MTRPGKIPSPAGFEPRIFRSRGGRHNHLAIETVNNDVEQLVIWRYTVLVVIPQNVVQGKRPAFTYISISLAQ